MKRFCSADQILNVGPTKHNVLCKGQSALDVILGHEDFLQQRGRSSLAPAETIEDVKRIDPEIKVVSANIMSLMNSVLKRSYLISHIENEDTKANKLWSWISPLKIVDKVGNTEHKLLLS